MRGENVGISGRMSSGASVCRVQDSLGFQAKGFGAKRLGKSRRDLSSLCETMLILLARDQNLGPFVRAISASGARLENAKLTSFVHKRLSLVSPNNTGITRRSEDLL